MATLKALLFDMDGVLVDVSSSYRVAIRKTVEHFSEKNITFSRIQVYKNRGGLNNDWDLCEQILKDRGCTIDKQAIIGVFQHYYLGDHFNGLIAEERWLLDGSILNLLHRRYQLGIVTGKPRAEAEFTLRRFEVAHCFATLVTMDDIPPDRGKPDPYGIRLALGDLQASGGWFCGDSIDDMRAARRSGIDPIGIVCANNKGARKSQRHLLFAHGAVAVFDHVNQIVEIIQ